MRDEIEAFAVESMGLLSGITEGAYTCMLSSRALSSSHPHMPAQGSQGCDKHDHVAPSCAAVTAHGPLLVSLVARLVNRVTVRSHRFLSSSEEIRCPHL
jgi:hypothetical protein